MAKGILKKGKLVMVLAAIGSCLCLIGCAAKEDATEAVNYASEDSSLTYAVHTELDGHAIELPQFTSTHDSAVIEELNQDIMDGPGAVYEKDKDGKEKRNDPGVSGREAVSPDAPEGAGCDAAGSAGGSGSVCGGAGCTSGGGAYHDQ